MAYDNTVKVKTANRDPITGEPGSHPLGTAVGTAAGAAVGIAGAAAIGAAAGSVVGPAGTIAGAAIGGIAGGLIGSDAAEGINPTDENAYWEKNYRTRDYVDADTGYDAYGPAYMYGVDAYVMHRGKDFASVEPQLSRDWPKARGTSALDWDDARDATRDAYDRLHNRTRS